jgi:two-component system, sensor histidine kinase YesM
MIKKGERETHHHGFSISNVIGFIRRLPSQFRITRLKNRFLLGMIVLAFLPVLVVGTVSFRISSRTIEQNHIASYSSNLYSFSRAIDLILYNAIRDSRQILAHSHTQEELEPERTAGRTDPRFDIATIRAFDQVARAVTISNKNIQSISIFDTQGREYYYSRTTVAGVASDRQLSPQFTTAAWFREAEAAGGKEVFFGRDVLASADADAVISCVKTLVSITDFRTIGLLVMTIPKSFLDSHAPQAGIADRMGEYLITEGEGGGLRSVFTTGSDPASYLGVMRSLPEQGSRTLTASRLDDYLIISQLNDTTGWNIVHTVGIAELLKDAGPIRTWTVVISGIMLVVVAVLFGIMSGMLSKPLTQLEAVIADVAQGQRTINAEFGDDEIGEIGNQFKSLVNTNIDLRERLITANLRQREAELSALQAQINPHFLYNTLDAIFWMAKGSRVEKIADLTLALSNVFKMSLNDGKETTTVEREIVHIRSYLAILKHRYRDRFDVTIDVDEEILGCPILNLSLQPFVENAIRHGLEPKVGKGSLLVRGEKVNGRIAFLVEDDGVGLPPDAEVSEGFAVANVRERIHLHHGEEFGVWLSSREGGGTCVRIDLPYSPPVSVPDIPDGGASEVAT